MGKYLVLWEIDKTKVPVNPKERGDGWRMLTNMVKQDLAKGVVKDWGAFVGELNGYFVAEGSEVELGKLTQQYVPFVFFKTYPAASIAQVEDVLKSLSGK